MPEKLPVHEAWPHINAIDWRARDFALKKAYVCALLSELTYYHIPECELRDDNRANLIPCFAYQSTIRQDTAIDFGAMMRELDFGDFSVVARRYAIVIGVRTPGAIFFAIRGTRYLYNWLANLWASTYVYESGGASARFHRGFFRAILACAEPVRVGLGGIIRSQADLVPIYVTGHSLGGALAAIMHSIWGMNVSGDVVHEGIVDNRLRTYASYTFGMPRYGDLRAVTVHRQPYHLYNDLDIVPTVPPRWLRFESCFNEFQLDGTSIESLQQRESLRFARWVTRLLRGRTVENHAIEVYRERIGSSV